MTQQEAQKQFVAQLPAPMFIPWGQSAVLNQGARILASRFANPTLQGLQQWFRQAATKKAALEAVKQTPKLLAEDALIDSLGNATTGVVEGYGDTRGLVRTVRKGNPFAILTDAIATIGNPSYEGFGDFIKNVGIASTAEASNYTPDEIDLSEQQVPSPSYKVLAPIQNPNLKGLQAYTPQTVINRAYIPNRDFTNRYNTPLTPLEQQGYNAWLKTVHPRQRSTYDYDLQGYYKAARNGIDPERIKLAVDPKGKLHFDDRFKKPNHYTFSTGSIYNGRDGFYGGEWTELGNNKWSYTVHPSNLYSNEELQDYFIRNEKGNRLIDDRGY